jgi:hypothetical protein
MSRGDLSFTDIGRFAILAILGVVHSRLVEMASNPSWSDQDTAD